MNNSDLEQRIHDRIRRHFDRLRATGPVSKLRQARAAALAMLLLHEPPHRLTLGRFEDQLVEDMETAGWSRDQIDRAIDDLADANVVSIHPELVAKVEVWLRDELRPDAPENQKDRTGAARKDQQTP